MDAPPRRRRPAPPGGTLRVAPRSADQVARDAFVDTAAWKRLRDYYRSRHPLCEDCRAAGRAAPSSHVHHVLARADRPDLAFELSNLRALCKPCHSRATLAERAGRTRDA